MYFFLKQRLYTSCKPQHAHAFWSLMNCYLVTIYLTIFFLFCAPPFPFPCSTLVSPLPSYQYVLKQLPTTQTMAEEKVTDALQVLKIGRCVHCTTVKTRYLWHMETGPLLLILI